MARKSNKGSKVIGAEIGGALEELLATCLEDRLER